MLWLVRPGARVLSTLLVSLVACSPGRPPPPEEGDSSASTTTGGLDAGIDFDADVCSGPPPPDRAGYCGNEVVPVLTEKPNVYFALDGSGSMRDELEGAGHSKLLSAKLAIRDLLVEIGHRVRYGALVFPDSGGDGACTEGSEVFPTSEGDPLDCNPGEIGPVLSRFLDSIGFRQAGGGTPVAASLSALTPTLLELEGTTSIVLITDGAPNCNSEDGCPPEHCIPNLEHAELGDRVCGVDIDCCDADLLGPEAYGNCIDDTHSENVIAHLSEAGIRTFVVGMPGSEEFAGVLDGMARAGDTARPDAETNYYSVSDIEGLTHSLFEIGSAVSLSCSFRLRQAPPDPDLLNVYFDNDLVELDDENGWSYQGDATIELHGNSCDVLKGGGVSQLQVVAGCPTLVK